MLRLTEGTVRPADVFIGLIKGRTPQALLLRVLYLLSVPNTIEIFVILNSRRSNVLTRTSKVSPSISILNLSL